MARRLSALFFVLLIGKGAAQPAPAQTLPVDCPAPLEALAPADVQAARERARDHGFLWRISKDGRTSYLYGTVHVAQLAWSLPGPVVAQSLRGARTLALELDILDPAIQERMVSGLRHAPRHRLPDDLDERLRRQARAACVDYSQIEAQPPELQLIAIELARARRDGLEAAFGVDAMLDAVGHGAQMEVVSLETPESQIAAIGMDSPQDTARFVREGLEDLEQNREREVVRRLVAAWVDSDFGTMDTYLDWCHCAETDMQRLVLRRTLYDRNPHLAEAIDALHARGRSVFAAVGSLHLFGAHGLPALLEQKGYRVERVVPAR